MPCGNHTANLVRQFRSSLTYFSGSGRSREGDGEFGENGGEIGFGELPLERFCGGFPVGLKVEQALGKVVEAGEGGRGW